MPECLYATCMRARTDAHAHRAMSLLRIRMGSCTRAFMPVIKTRSFSPPGLLLPAQKGRHELSARGAHSRHATRLRRLPPIAMRFSRWLAKPRPGPRTFPGDRPHHMSRVYISTVRKCCSPRAGARRRAHAGATWNADSGQQLLRQCVAAPPLGPRLRHRVSSPHRPAADGTHELSLRTP